MSPSDSRAVYLVMSGVAVLNEYSEEDVDKMNPDQFEHAKNKETGAQGSSDVASHPDVPSCGHVEWKDQHGHDQNCNHKRFKLFPIEEREVASSCQRYVIF